MMIDVRESHVTNQMTSDMTKDDVEMSANRDEDLAKDDDEGDDDNDDDDRSQRYQTVALDQAIAAFTPNAASSHRYDKKANLGQFPPNIWTPPYCTCFYSIKLLLCTLCGA